MANRLRRVSANDQYLGTCKKCKQKEALLEGYCWKCQQKYPNEFMAELTKMGFKL